MVAKTGPPDPHRLLETLERLLAITTGDLRAALTSAADLVAHTMRADKVDVFVYDASRDSLVAVGTSNQPVSALQKRHGLDVLPIANGSRVVTVFQTGKTFVTGRLDEDPEEVRGVKEVLKIRSCLGVPLDVGGVRRGTLMLAALAPDLYTEADARFAETIGRWVSLVVHRSELVEASARGAEEQGRRAVAEELITTLAHDLRNYLAPIELRVGLVRRRSEREGRENDLRDLDVAQRGIERFKSIISNILDVARADQGVLQIAADPIDLIALLEDLAAALARPEQPIDVRYHPIDVKYAEEIFVVGDAPRLQQCVENILSNALKFAPKGTPIVVQVARVQTDTGWQARVQIIDEGPGVAPEVLPHIFQRFVTGRRQEGGLGLGLYLAKRIAVLHGGELTVDSAPGRGTTFTLTLPGPRSS